MTGAASGLGRSTTNAPPRVTDRFRSGRDRPAWGSPSNRASYPSGCLDSCRSRVWDFSELADASIATRPMTISSGAGLLLRSGWYRPHHHLRSERRPSRWQVASAAPQRILSGQLPADPARWIGFLDSSRREAPYGPTCRVPGVTWRRDLL